jgi:hypothetical protein
VGLTTLPCKKEIVEKPPRNSAIFNGRRLQRRPRPKLGCGAKERERRHPKKCDDSTKSYPTASVQELQQL